MPVITAGSATTTMVTSKAPAKRFELPALEFKFASLTEGTDIPPLQPSPVEEAPPKAAAPKAAAIVKPKPKVAEAPENGMNTSCKINGAQAVNGATSTTYTAANNLSARYRPNTNESLNYHADEVPASPTLSARPGSIRRLFSRNLLNTAYANGEAEDQRINASCLDIHHNTARPDSRSAVSMIEERKLRRTSGWFRRLRGGGLTSSNDSINGDYTNTAAKRASMVMEEPPKPVELPKPPKPASPPAPMIPELAKLKAKVEIDDDGSLGSDLFKNIK